MLARADPTMDAGPRSAAARERLCVATRSVKPVEGMIRFVVGPEGQLVADLKRRLPGRGVWVTATRRALAEAIRRGAFARSFKRDVRVGPDLAEEVEHLLERAALDALAIAYKAGEVVAGFAQVEAALRQKPVTALLHAADASPDGVRKIAAAANRRFGPQAAHIPMVASFTSAQLDLALGRANVVHAALLAGRASGSFLERCRSLAGFRTDVPEDRHGAS
jgi:predicted RNA-binding protein YlxR (DUF448 family)